MNSAPKMSLPNGQKTEFAKYLSKMLPNLARFIWSHCLREREEIYLATTKKNLIRSLSDFFPKARRMKIFKQFGFNLPSTPLPFTVSFNNIDESWLQIKGLSEAKNYLASLWKIDSVGALSFSPMALYHAATLVDNLIDNHYLGYGHFTDNLLLPITTLAS